VDDPELVVPSMTLIRGSGWLRAARHVAAAIVVLLALTGLLLPGVSRMPRPVLPILFTLPLVLAALRRDGRALRWWAAYVCGFTAFVLLRYSADQLGFPVQTAYPIAADRLLGFGTVPTVWLQAHLPRDGALVLLAIGVHLSYYLTPPLAGLWLWLRTEQFPAYVRSLLLLYAVSLLIHVVLPTTPPWLAALHGDLPGASRLLYDVLYPNAPQFYDFGDRVAGNHVAAMPSVHTAAIIVMALFLRRPAAWLYVGAMGFALVWLGEHYLVDVLAGVALGWVCARDKPRDRDRLTEGGTG
jgi:membrane-associated phospholipid phosphatase